MARKTKKKPKMQDRLIDRATKAGATAAGTLGGAVISRKLTVNKEGKQIVNPNLHGPLFVVGGLALSTLVENEELQNVGNGLTAFGALKTAAQLSKDKAEETFGMVYFAPKKKEEDKTSGIGVLRYDETLIDAANNAMAGMDEDVYDEEEFEE